MLWCSRAFRKDITSSQPVLCHPGSQPTDYPNPSPLCISGPALAQPGSLPSSSFPGTALVAPSSLLPPRHLWWSPSLCSVYSVNGHTVEFPRGPFCSLMLLCCTFLCSHGCWPSSLSAPGRTLSPVSPPLSPWNPEPMSSPSLSQAPLRLDTGNSLFPRRCQAAPPPALPLPFSGPVMALPSLRGPRHHWPRALGFPGRLCQVPPLSSQGPLGTNMSPQWEAARSGLLRFPTLGGLPSSSTKSKSGETAYL